MTSPRSGRSLGKHTLVALAVLAAAAAGPLRAQDTAAAVARDSAPPAGRAPATVGQVTPGAPLDSLRPDSLRPDSLRPDSLQPDSLRPDSLPPDTTRPAAAVRPIPPPAPVDSALARACVASSDPELVTVTFRPSATPAEREAVAAEVGGTLLDQSEHQTPGAWYIHVPGSARDRSVADRLILLAPVLAVSVPRCPS